MTAFERDYNFRDRETHECFNTKLKKNCYKNCNSSPPSIPNVGVISA